jgi:uncharacterized membrane protein YbaN (DUF454 family)
MRVAYFIIGVLLVVLGLVGAVLPLLPTTVFLILAAGAFARSSPRVEAWLLDHPALGPPIRRWRERGAIAPGAKLAALGGMTVGFGMFLATTRPGWPLVLLVALLLVAVATYVVTRPDR